MLQRRKEVFLKKIKKYKKVLETYGNIMYTIYCCGMIAMKREVAAERQVFRGANVKKAGFMRLKETDDKSLYKQYGLRRRYLLTAT